MVYVLLALVFGVFIWNMLKPTSRIRPDPPRQGYPDTTGWPSRDHRQDHPAAYEHDHAMSHDHHHSGPADTSDTGSSSGSAWSDSSDAGGSDSTSVD